MTKFNPESPALVDLLIAKAMKDHRDGKLTTEQLRIALGDARMCITGRDYSQLREVFSALLKVE